MIVGIIPARYDSTRFPGKLLADLNGKPVLERTWSQVKKAISFDRVIIAAGDAMIASAARRFGAEVIELYDDVPSGSDRIWKAVEKLKLNYQTPEFIVNIQGDEPFIRPDTIDSIVEKLESDPTVSVATAAAIIKYEEEYLSESVVKVVIDNADDALYFSRSPIPHGWSTELKNAYRHLGIYAYKYQALKSFIHWNVSELEQMERLEQLRFIENGVNIKVAIVEEEGVGIDTEDDLMIARRIFSENESVI